MGPAGYITFHLEGIKYFVESHKREYIHHIKYIEFTILLKRGPTFIKYFQKNLKFLEVSMFQDYKSQATSLKVGDFVNELHNFLESTDNT